VKYYIRRAFLKEFSMADDAGLRQRFSGPENGVVTVHPDYLMSVFSRGGAIRCKKPDLEATLHLTDTVRGLIRPRHGYRLLAIQGVDIPMLLLAYYSQDKAFQHILGTKGGKALGEYLAEKAGLHPVEVSLFLNQLIDGYGNARLLKRLEKHGRHVGKAELEGLKVKLVALFPAINDFKRRLLASLAANDNVCHDIVRSRIIIPADRHYRSHSMLMNSGYGNILSIYLCRFLQIAQKCDSRLVFARDNEFLFEIPKDGGGFLGALEGLFDEKMVPIFPAWKIWEQNASAPSWRALDADVHKWAVEEWFS